MTQAEYLATLQRALSGLPASTITEIMADYAQHFTDGLAEGRNESDIASALGEPRKVATEFNTVTRLELFQQHKSLASFWHLLFSLILLLAFNLLLALPTFLFVLLLFSGFAVAAALYFSGIAIIVGILLDSQDTLALQIVSDAGFSALTGVSLILFGILLALVCLSIGYLALIGFVRYLKMNMSFLKNSPSPDRY